MAIKRSIEDLPRPAQTPARLPSKNPIVVNAVAEAWFGKLVESGYLDFASAIPELPYRASSAGSRCDRQSYYRLTKTPESNPSTIADLWRMHLGSMVHEGLAPTLRALGDGWRDEINVDLRPNVQGSAHADLVRFVAIASGSPMIEIDRRAAIDAAGQPVRDRWGDPVDEFMYSDGDASTTCWLLPGSYDPAVERAEHVVELKTINGYGFKMIATNFRSPAEGAKFGHILQGAMAADALGCNKLTVAYMSMELLSPGMASGFADDEIARFAAEWHFSIEQLRPVLDAEYARIARLIRLRDAGQLPAREIHDLEYPDGAVIVSPQPHSKSPWRTLQADGTLAESGTAWYCGYCSHRDTCITDGDAASDNDSVL